MLTTTRKVFQAIISNGYEVRVDRKQRSDGTMLWLINRPLDEEAFYFFSDETESQVVETIAWQYCTSNQLEAIYDEVSVPAMTSGQSHLEYA